MYLIIILLFIAGLSNAGMDVLQYRPSHFIFKGDWWHTKGRFAWNQRKWYTKYIFTMVSDGWHALKFIQIISYCSIIVLYFELNTIHSILAVTIMYTIVGTAFEIGYNYIWGKK